jgi:cell division protein FtsQ
MWDRPEILNGVSSTLIAASVLLAVYGGVIGLANLPAFPLRHVGVTNASEPGGELRHVTREQVQAVVGERLNGTFFTLDLEAARAAFSALPWVRSVEVRRIWPDRLEVAIEEHAALANWNGGKLVNSHGELFDAPTIEGLPAFSGPPGSESEVTRRYREFSATLVRLGFAPRQIALSPRAAWELKLDSGLALKLGREQPSDPLARRLERFVSAYPATVARVRGRLDVADLRYVQGFALRVSPGSVLETKTGKGLGAEPAKESGNATDAPKRRAPAKGKA